MAERSDAVTENVPVGDADTAPFDVFVALTVTLSATTVASDGKPYPLTVNVELYAPLMSNGDTEM